jgi:hypothetical protein
MQKNWTAAQGQVTAAALPKSGRKAPGTRAGTLQDWREGSNKSGKTSVGIGKTLRDGR